MRLSQWLAILINVVRDIIASLYFPCTEHQITQCVYWLYTKSHSTMRILRLFFGSWNFYELTKLANSARFGDGLALAYAKNHRMSTSTWIEFWLANFWLFDRKLHSIGNQNWSIWRSTLSTPQSTLNCDRQIAWGSQNHPHLQWS